MIYSMTGFGRAVVITDNVRIIVEAKSLNSKQLDLSLRIPSRFREIEMRLREIIGKKLERGKVDINIYFELINADDQLNGLANDLNVPVIRSLKQRISKISNDLGIAEPTDWFPIFLRFPEVMHSDHPSPVATSDEIELLNKTLNDCLDNLLAFRSQEGSKLEELFLQKVNNIQQLLGKVDIYETERILKIKDKLVEGLQKISQTEYDSNRLEQELIFYIEKLDINEEKNRLQQHLDYFKETLNILHPGQGKKLGFIAQEMGREINTLGSKSNHADLQRLVVQMKDELEQIKEQVLNVM